HDARSGCGRDPHLSLLQGTIVMPPKGRRRSHYQSITVPNGESLGMLSAMQQSLSILPVFWAIS
ncbi:MAG: hypothetical protein ABIV36_23380, partial [Sphingobium limneticum]